MEKKELWLFVAGGAVEIIAVGIGFAMSPKYGWWIAGVGIAILVIALWRAHRAKSVTRPKPLSLAEIEAQKELISERIECRKEYLPDLKRTLNEYINQVDYIANHNEDLMKPESYNRVYLNQSFKAGSIKDAGFSLMGVMDLYNRELYRDNPVLRHIEDTDGALTVLAAKMGGLNSFVKDSIVRTNVKGYPEATHIAYSYVVFNRFLRIHFNAKPFVYKFYYRVNEKAMNRLRDLQNQTNARIDELLEGVEDEL